MENAKDLFKMTIKSNIKLMKDADTLNFLTAIYHESMGAIHLALNLDIIDTEEMKQSVDAVVSEYATRLPAVIKKENENK